MRFAVRCGDAATSFATAAAAATGPLDSVRNWLYGDATAPERRPPDQAFRISARANDTSMLLVDLTPARGC